MTNDSLPDTEREVLGACLLNGDIEAWSTVTEILPHPLMFNEQIHRIVYMATEKALNQHNQIDALTVANVCRTMETDTTLRKIQLMQTALANGRGLEMTKRDFRGSIKWWGEDTDTVSESVLDFIGGHAALVDITNTRVPKASLEAHCHRLREYYRLRYFKYCVKHLGSSLERAGAIDTMADIVSEMYSSLETGNDNRSSVDLVSHAQSVLSGEAAVDHPACSWGVSALDNRFPLHAGHYMVVAAYPGGGKSALALSAAYHTAKLVNKPGAVLYISLEMDATQMAQRLIGIMSGSATNIVQKGQWSADEVTEWTNSLSSHTGTLQFNMGAGTVYGVLSIARAHCRRYPDCRLVVVDYMQCITGGEEEYAQATKFSNELMRLHLDTGVGVMALSQFNRSGGWDEKRQCQKVHMGLLKSTGAIAQDATGVLLMQGGEASVSRPTVYMEMAKNRLGPQGECETVFLKDRGFRFTDRHGASRMEQKYQQRPSDSEELFAGM